VGLLGQIAVVVVVGALISALFARFKLPSIAGLLFAGALVGPHGLRLVGEGASIDAVAEVGVVILLFTIGLEFSLKRLGRIWKLVAVGGLMQVGLTIGAVLAITLALGFTVGQGVFYGFVFALSSTAIVLRALTERGEADAPHGRFVVGALIFQDLCVVPMVLVVPLLATGGQGGAVLGIGLALGKAALLVVASVLVARLAVPRLFALVDAGRSRETFILTVLAICIGTAFLTSSVGLSLELGAFLAGVVLADTDYAQRAMGDVLPLGDVLTSIFFVSLGMMFDPGIVAARPAAVGLVLAGLIFGKAAIATFSALVMRFPARAAFLAGVGLAQFGEFGFVLVRLGESNGLLTPAETGTVLAAGVLSMFVTPLAVRVAPHLTAGEALLRPLERLLGVRGMDEPTPEHTELSGHVVIVGFGPAGRILAHSLKRTKVPYLVLELNAETVQRARADGEPVYYGDVTSPEAMAHARVEAAGMVVLVINDPRGMRRAVAALRRFAPGTPVILRSRYLSDRESLIDLGASDVVTMELEAGVEIVARVLRGLGVARNVISDRIREARADTQESARKLTLPREGLAEMEDLADLKVDRFLVREGAFARGRSLAAMQVREATGALIMAIRRKGALLEEPDPKEELAVDDVVYLVGPGPARRAAMSLLETGEANGAKED
jgi:monovalent cation:H+ antiporter-2, CPA2 family